MGSAKSNADGREKSNADGRARSSANGNAEGRAKSSADTPLMQQHRAIKQRYPDAILLFRVGDFYETFGEDAITASKILGITLTKRNNGAAASSELAGFPYHALDSYLHKLVKAGHRVAVCDQLEDPKSVKGIVKRGVTELVTPGVALNDKLLEGNQNNFLAGIFFPENWPEQNKGKIGVSFLDISTGEFFLAEGNAEYIDKLLQTLRPAEVIFQRSYQRAFKEVFGHKFYTYTLESWLFEEGFATDTLLRHFQTHSLKGFGIEDMTAAVISAGAVLHYLKDTEHPNLQHISSLQRIDREDYLWMDKWTIRNLELLGSSYDGEQRHSLLNVLDNTVSAMGARLLKRWLLMPLRDQAAIERRLDAVELLIKDPDGRAGLVQRIRQCGDVERLVARIPVRKTGPRELIQLARGLEEIVQIRAAAHNFPEGWLKDRCLSLDPCPQVAERIVRTIVENPPAAAAKGDFVRAGVHTELDRLRGIASGGKEYVAGLQQKEAGRSGISSLKVGFNSVFGYYLEVTNSHKNKVPADWIRKQTLAGAERYITPELKQYEEQITGAEDKIRALEMEIYEDLLLFLQTTLAPLQANGHQLAVLDCLLCFAQNALQYNYRKPQLHQGGDLELKGSRHPVIERQLPAGEPYVPNDVLLDPASQQIIILTGPNMSGKSALLRQTALITLMAHIGSFVPCDSARVPLTDKIFTRVGASDNLSGGESTFMVEMNETASILNNLSTGSLILLDEIGRGTSTYDGISIAWSIAEFLHRSPCKPKTLFATHYHELNELANKFPGIVNFHITNKEVGNKVIFLRKLAPGGSTHSFGIHVAKMAGMPVALVRRAEEILRQLEDKHVGSPVEESLKKIATSRMQLSIFDEHTETFQRIRRLLEATDINRLTPVEALLKLQEIQNELK
jgi:DNA mismatch repair protein MutS